MSGTIDDQYFEWLYSQIGAIGNRNPARSYWSLARQLYTTEFVWLVPNDDNRMEDGKELREEFLDYLKREQGIDEYNPEWLSLGCSMLEMFIALARRASFEDGKEPGDWFWEFMENLELKTYTDARYNGRVQRRVHQTMERVIYRTYLPNGDGGIFPLRGAHEDQRKVELWYQMSAYILENSPI